MPSERARRLIEELHEVHSLEKRWTIAEAFLREASEEAVLLEREDVRMQRFLLSGGAK